MKAKHAMTRCSFVASVSKTAVSHNVRAASNAQKKIRSSHLHERRFEPMAVERVRSRVHCDSQEQNAFAIGIELVVAMGVECPTALWFEASVGCTEKLFR